MVRDLELPLDLNLDRYHIVPMGYEMVVTVRHFVFLRYDICGEGRGGAIFVFILFPCVGKKHPRAK